MNKKKINLKFRDEKTKEEEEEKSKEKYLIYFTMNLGQRQVGNLF